MIDQTNDRDTSRRDLLKKGAVAGAVVWTAPLVMGVPSAFAVGSAPATTPPTNPAEPTNLAPAGTASMSSQYTGLACTGPELGINNDTNGNWSSTNSFSCNTGAPDFQHPMFHTNSGPAEWWQVDLGAMHTITSVTIFNRTDNGAESRARNVLLEVSPDGSTWTSVPFGGVMPGTGTTWSTSTYTGSTSARFVRVTNGITDFFHLAEVQVFGI